MAVRSCRQPRRCRDDGRPHRSGDGTGLQHRRWADDGARALRQFLSLVRPGTLGCSRGGRALARALQRSKGGARAGLRAACFVRRGDGGDRALSGSDRDDQALTTVEWTITVTDVPGAAATMVIWGGLNRYNREKAGYWDSRTLAVLVSDPVSHEVIGGALGHTSLGLAFIAPVFLPPE